VKIKTLYAYCEQVGRIGKDYETYVDSYSYITVSKTNLKLVGVTNPSKCTAV
jgi:hypothetical protein